MTKQYLLISILILLAILWIVPVTLAQDAFEMNLGDTVTSGYISSNYPSYGAGEIESPGGYDEYIFFAITGQEAIFAWLTGNRSNIFWMLESPSNQVIFFDVSNQQVVFQETGDYTLRVSDEENVSNSELYAFKTHLVPPSDGPIPIEIGDVVSPNVPVEGAGKLEFAGVVDIYEFYGEAEQAILFDWIRRFEDKFDWWLTSPSGETVFSDINPPKEDLQITLPETGTYNLTVDGHEMFDTGNYNFGIHVLPPSNAPITIAIGDTISRDIPIEGAGVIEIKGELDTYVFPGEAGQEIVFDWISGSSLTFDWWVYAPSGMGIIADHRVDDWQITLPETGIYTLLVKGDDENHVGVYSYRIIDVPPPDILTMSVGDTISNGVPFDGAGNLEVPGAVDIYEFTASAGEEVVFNWISGVNFDWWLTSPTEVTVFSDSRILSFGRQVVLPETGDYTLFVDANGIDDTGTYSFSTNYVPPVDGPILIMFGQMVSDDSPIEGAGDIEVKGAIDVYEFPATAGDQIILEWLNGDVYNFKWWLTSPSDEQVFYQIHTTTKGFFAPETGMYTLAIAGNTIVDTGTYAFVSHLVPLPDGPFQIAVGDVISNDNPAEGAGDIEVNGAVDLYEFYAEAGDRIIIEWLSGPGLSRQVISPSTQGFPWESIGADAQATLPETGVYTIRIASRETIGSGTYSFTMHHVPSPDGPFIFNIGDTISKDYPVDGAGDLEVFGAEDIYEFYGEAGDEIIFDWINGDDYALDWAVYSATRNVFYDSVYSITEDHRVTLPFSTTYTLRVDSDYHNLFGTGIYSFASYRVPPPDGPFAINIGDTVSNGDPAPGAGNLDSIAATDVYTFTGSAGDEVVINWLDQTQFPFTLADPSMNIIYMGDVAYDGRFYLWETGIYTLTVGGDYPEIPGTYSFQLLPYPSPEGPFPLDFGDTVSNGVPAPGAGNLESPGAIDIYEFTGTAGNEVVFNWISGEDVYVYLGSPSWNLVFEEGREITDKRVVLSETGKYTLWVEGFQLGSVTPYSFGLSLIPEPQTFNISIDDRISDGVPTIGAGNLEIPGSVDIYTFQVDAETDITFDWVIGSTNAFDWLLETSDGTTLFSGSPTDQVLSLSSDAYSLTVFGSELDDTGTYQFEIVQLLLGAPVANVDDYVTPYETTLAVSAAEGVLNNDTDVDGDGLTAVLVNEPNVASSFVLNPDGSFTYVPNFGHVGEDSFTYRASAGTLESNLATVTIFTQQPVIEPDPDLEITPTPEAPPALDIPSVSGNTSAGTILPTFTFALPVNADNDPIPAEWFNLVISKADDTEVLNEWLPVDQYCVGGVCQFTLNTKSLPAGLLSSTYSWKVRSWHSDMGMTEFSTDENFSIYVAAPDMPSNVQVTTSDGNINISFAYDPAVAWYHLVIKNQISNVVYDTWHSVSDMICEDNHCDFVLPKLPNTVNNEHGTPGLINGDYILELSAWGPGGFNNGNMDAATSSSFTVNLGQSSIAVIQDDYAITNTDTGSPTFRWIPAENATYQLLWIGTPSGLPDALTSTPINTYYISWYPVKHMVCLEGESNPCVLTPQDVFLPNGQYEYWVLSWGPAGRSTWGSFSGWMQGSVFRVNAAEPTAPIPLAPTGTISKGVTDFSWKHVPGVTWYRLWVGNDDGSTMYDHWYRANEIICPESGICAVQPEGLYLPENDYAWYIQSYNPAWNSVNAANYWSDGPNTFTVKRSTISVNSSGLGASDN